MTRFQVLTVEGWRIHPSGGRGPSFGPPGVTATVYDTLYDRDIATYRSEELRGHNTLSRRRALNCAREHAARLEAEHGC